jgi:dUTP pyrophosphatase
MTRYQLLIKFTNGLNEEARKYYISKQNNLEPEDSGFDLMTNRDEYIDDSLVKYIDSNINCAMIDTKTNKCVGYYLYPRSSFSKYPLIMANHIGIIDAGYRGNIKSAVRLYQNNDFTYDRKYETGFKIKKGTRLFQLCAPDLSPFLIKIVDDLPTSLRGSGGFGSTGQ